MKVKFDSVMPANTFARQVKKRIRSFFLPPKKVFSKQIIKHYYETQTTKR